MDLRLVFEQFCCHHRCQYLLRKCVSSQIHVIQLGRNALVKANTLPLLVHTHQRQQTTLNKLWSIYRRPLKNKLSRGAICAVLLQMLLSVRNPSKLLSCRNSRKTVPKLIFACSASQCVIVNSLMLWQLSVKKVVHLVQLPKQLEAKPSDSQLIYHYQTAG